MGLGNLSLRSKLLLGFSGVALIATVVGIIGFVAVNLIHTNSNEVTEVRSPSIENLMAIATEAQNIRGSIRSLGISGLPNEIRVRQYDNINPPVRQH
jgi:CHASE3 domain sensor protein